MQTTETKSKHTPGPWDVIPQNGAGPMIAHRYDTGNDINPTGLRLVCHVLERKASFEVDAANARLIAAAPTMYDYVSAKAEAGDAVARSILEMIHAGR